MIKRRIKIKAVLKDFKAVVRRSIVQDAQNQENKEQGNLSINNLEILSAALFFHLFREYENFVRDVFLLYTQQKQTISGSTVHSYLRPLNFHHAERLLMSSMNFLDWNSPNTIINRSETYLKDGFPIKLAFTTKREKLDRYRKLRNHYAHNSSHSMSQFKKILRIHYGTTPARINGVGAYLILSSRDNPRKYYLQVFFEDLIDLADAITY